MLQNKIFKKFLVWLILFSIMLVSYLIFLPDIGFGTNMPRVNYRVYLPILFFSEKPPEPTPTPTTPPPLLATVYVDNQLGQNMRFEILGTGIGRKIIPPGEHYYGSFPPGTYRYVATAGGAKDEKTHTYLEDTVTIWEFRWVK